MASKYLMVFLLIFLVGSMGGYLLEVLFRRFFSAKKWVNPGFMEGPWLPLYGLGILVMLSLCWMFYVLLPDSLPLYNPMGGMFGREEASGATAWDLIPIGCIWASLILLEFLAGLIFVKGFHVRLWDYRNMRGNVLGVVCPLFSVIWLIVDLLYYYGAGPFIYRMFEGMFHYLFEGGAGGDAVNFLFLFFMGGIYGIFLYDLVKSLNLFGKARQLARESGIEARYEAVRRKAKAIYAGKKAEILSYIPETTRKKDKEMLERGKEEFGKLEQALRKLILIDPGKKGSSENYGEDGRPVKED